jgi:hypothetical protein
VRLAADYAYWNTPDADGVTRRQRKWAAKVGADPTLDVLAGLPCLGNSYPPGCVGSCVTCEARERVR